MNPNESLKNGPAAAVSASAETVPSRIPLIGEDAPAFEAHTTQGPLKFPGAKV